MHTMMLGSIFFYNKNYTKKDCFMFLQELIATFHFLLNMDYTDFYVFKSKGRRCEALVTLQSITSWMTAKPSMS